MAAMADEANRAASGPAAETGADPGERRPAGVPAYARNPVLVVTGAVALAAVIGIVLWLLLRGGEENAAQLPGTKATAVSLNRLNAFAGSIGHPIYWVGPQPSFTYELSRTGGGRVYIRYLPAGVKAGSASPNYLTVGTYPQPNAFATLRATAQRQGTRTIRLAGGGRAFQYKARPTSVYLAYPRSNYQIEIFDPSPKRALRLVASGRVTPVGAPPRTQAGSTATSVEQLKALSEELGHPIYWAGAQQGVTYELTRTRDNRVYIRYLPSGAQVGDTRPKYLTVGTYPQKGAFGILKATAAKNRVRTIAVAGGGLAFVDRKRPTSAYIAYPGLDVQVEVYDPTPGRAGQLLQSGEIEPVR
jgi:hypothetical protein